MNARVTALIEAARQLSPDERAELRHRLQLDFDYEAPTTDAPEAVEAAWVEEVAQRIGRCDRGETASISHDDVMGKLGSMLRQA
jgi:Putative addiction module component